MNIAKSARALRTCSRFAVCNNRVLFAHGVRSFAVQQETTSKPDATTKLQSLVNEKKDRETKPKEEPLEHEIVLGHPLWTDYQIHGVEVTHKPTNTFLEKLAYWTIRIMRFNFDVATGFNRGKLTESKWLNRIIFLETVAGVPGSIGGTLRHLASLRRMERDHGWIYTLLEEAENERMHLLVAMTLKQPDQLFRLCVLGAQGVFYNFYFLSYLISPRFCHHMVGYLEEEAVITYTKCLKEIESGKSLEKWVNLPAPELAREYWHLGENATMKDVILVIRADEAHHRDVNHTLGDLNLDAPNPFTLKE